MEREKLLKLKVVKKNSKLQDASSFISMKKPRLNDHDRQIKTDTKGNLIFFTNKKTVSIKIAAKVKKNSIIYMIKLVNSTGTFCLLFKRT